MNLCHQASPDKLSAAIPVETMRTLLVCRGPIAFETLEVYRRCRWQLPHAAVSSKEWIAARQRTAPWIADLPPGHVHYIQEYDDVEAVLRIAKEHQIDAVYPGYGFLAESAALAERVRQAGLRFVGPTPETLRAAGEKDAAMALARRLGIPTIPGDDALIAFARTHRQEAIAAETVQRTLALGRRYPGCSIRLKHPAGGGGKGQRVLTAQGLRAPEAPDAVRDALAKVWAEMGVSSADARKGVLLELDIPRPLHWEVQLFGDGDTVVHFAARDCSLQNHASQKFIELALYPEALAQELQGLDQQRNAARIASLQRRQSALERICAAAVHLGTAIRLRGAATVEFLIDQQGAPYFLEVNPRIQVEHAVTEGIARVRGQPVCLVELQQRVAAGERLDFRQTDITFVGDAMEVRLNAWHEDLSPVLGGVIHTLRLDVPAELRANVRIDASGLLQRREPWLVPSYDANFALIVVTGSHRRETLARMLTVLEATLQIDGDAALHTNLQPVLGMLTLMQILPSGTEFRTDTSLLWMACAAVVVARRQAVLSLLPTFPRQRGTHDPARFARLLRTTLEAGFAHPSRLLASYLKRLTEPAPRPLSALEVLWQLAEELTVPLFEEEKQLQEALRGATAALWTTLSASRRRYTALVRAAAAGCLEHHADYDVLCRHLQATEPDLGPEEAAGLLHTILAWLGADIPAVTELLRAIESTQLHVCLAAQNNPSLPRPTFIEDEATVAHLHRLLSTSLRPAVLRHGELCAPMEATIYHRPEPGAPPFVQIGAEIHVGQTLALLEAMKMFTELASPVDGVLADILVEDGHGVHTGTPLFKIATQDAAIETTDDALYRRVDGTWQNRFGLLLLQAPLEASGALPGHGARSRGHAA
jgi:acetyl-CoA carboxylase biotin carboxylase subunit